MSDSDAVDLSLLVFRSWIGVVMLAHGVNHVIGGGKIGGTARWFGSMGMRWPMLQAWLASLTEIGAGVLLVLGLLTPFGGAGVVGVMAVAWAINHRGNGFFIFRPGEGWEYVITLLVGAVALGAVGPGGWSLDEALDVRDDLDGWTGLLVAALAGGGGAALLLGVSWRPPSRDDGQGAVHPMTGEASATDASTPDRPDRSARSEHEGSDGSTSTFESLEVPEYRLLFVAGLISFLAVQAQVVARGWLANELTGDNTGLGGVYMAFGVPLLVATPFGGVLADRVSKRAILIATQLSLGGSAAWLGLGVVFDFVEYWMLLAVSVIQAVSFAFLGPARISMTTEVVGRRLLTNAIVLGQMSINSTRVFGPALAGIGIGIAWFGVGGVYLASAGFSVVAMLALLPLPPGTTDTGRPRRSVRSEFGEALAYVTREREIGILVLTSFVVVMMGFPYLAFLPRIATELLDVGAAGYGALSAASAVGALAVSVWVAGRGDRRMMWRIQAAGGTLFGVAIIGLSLVPGIAVALVVIVAVGGAASAFQAMNNSLALGLADFEYHGRIQSLMMLSFSGFGMASLPLGGLADAVGLRPTLALMGSVIVVAMAVSTAVLRGTRQRQSTSLA